jgi:hypothetical protein
MRGASWTMDGQTAAEPALDLVDILAGQGSATSSQGAMPEPVIDSTGLKGFGSSKTRDPRPSASSCGSRSP